MNDKIELLFSKVAHLLEEVDRLREENAALRVWVDGLARETQTWRRHALGRHHPIEREPDQDADG